MDISPGRMNITPRRMNITPRPMNITPGRMNTMPDYQGAPVVVTPRQSDRGDGRSGSRSGVRPASPDRLVSPRGSGEGRGSGGSRDDSWRDPVDRLRDQRDRNARGGSGGSVDRRYGGGDGGRGDGRGDWDHRDDRHGDPRDRHDSDRHDWRDHHDHRDHHRSYLISRPRDYFIYDRPNYYYTGSGLSIRGGYLGDRFRVNARLNSGVYGLNSFRTGYYCPSATWLTCDRGWVGGHWNGYYWTSYEWPYGYPSSLWVQRGQFTDFTTAVPASEAPVIEGDVRMEAMQVPATRPAMQLPISVDDTGAMTSQSLSATELVEASPLDDGLTALMGGDAARGADALRVHLREHRDDGRALRLLAAALEEAGEPVDAAAVMRMAHEMDPALATESLGLAALGYSDARLRDMVDRAVIHAHRVKSQHSTEAASAWLVVGVLMREQGRDDLAREMIKRAERAGLREDVVDSLELAWR